MCELEEDRFGDGCDDYDGGVGGGRWWVEELKHFTGW